MTGTRLFARLCVMNAIEVECIPILTNNFVFLIKNTQTGVACVIDPGESDTEIVLDHLKKNRLNLETILITHHHADHIDGIAVLCNAYPNTKVYAPYKNQGLIPRVQYWLKEGDVVSLEGLGDFHVLELPGHTLGHIAYHQVSQFRLFSGDVLFGLGCGRLFEGSPSVAYRSLQRLKSLPPETHIFCTHEYTAMNLKFTETLIAQKKIPALFQGDTFSSYKTHFLATRAKGLPAIPLLLENEMRWNPFLLSETVEEFTVLREIRDTFKS